MKLRSQNRLKSKLPSSVPEKGGCMDQVIARFCVGVEGPC